MTRTFVGDAATWLELKPGSRLGRFVRRTILKAVHFFRARPTLARLAWYLLRLSRTLEARVKRTLMSGGWSGRRE